MLVLLSSLEYVAYKPSLFWIAETQNNAKYLPELRKVKIFFGSYTKKSHDLRSRLGQ